MAVFINNLSIGGTEKAACLWARGLHRRGHCVSVLTLQDGPRRTELTQSGIDVRVVSADEAAISGILRDLETEVIHAHVPGYPHEGDVLGAALSRLPKRIPVVQTNIFGRLENPAEDRWTEYRLFISWTSCVQAARRAARPLDEAFFRRASIAVYPLDPDDGPAPADALEFRKSIGVQENEILFGRFSRAEPNKWSELPLRAFRRAVRSHPRIKLLLREPPPDVAHRLRASEDRDRFVILPATSDAGELRRTMAATDVVLHSSLIGESFGYGIAEPMNLGKPVIVNSTPCGDQAQLELVRHGECGLVASTTRTMEEAILRLAAAPEERSRLGSQARTHIRKLASLETSLDRVESALQAVVSGTDNDSAQQDLARARAQADELDREQFGHTPGEQLALRAFALRVRFHHWRKRWMRARG